MQSAHNALRGEAPHETRKCVFLAMSVDYLGVKVDAEGIHPLPDKVRAIKEAPAPPVARNSSSYQGGPHDGTLGSSNLFGPVVIMCLPSMATLLAPLHRLLRRGEASIWCEKHACSCFP